MNNQVGPAPDGNVDHLRTRSSTREIPHIRGEPDVGLAIHDAGPTKTGAMASAMREVDLDGDGVVAAWEVTAMVNKKNEATREVRDTRKILVYVLGILALSVAANALITALCVDQAKETETNSGFLTDRDGKALRTDTSLVTGALSSNMKDSTLRQLESFTVTGATGSMDLRVTGFARYDDKAAKHGSTVVLYCALGSVELDGTTMYYRETSDGAFTFSRIGLNLTSDTSRQRRSNPHHLRQRRSGCGSGKFCVEGLFSVVDLRDLSSTTENTFEVRLSHRIWTDTTTTTTTTTTATTTTTTTTTTDVKQQASFGPSTANTTTLNTTTGVR